MNKRNLTKKEGGWKNEVNKWFDKNKKAPKTLVPYLTGEEMKILLEQPDTTTSEGRRDIVLLVTLYDTAARVQELIDLKIKDVRISNPAVITLSGKGRKPVRFLL